MSQPRSFALDPQDQALLAALQADPRARATRLGDALGMSAPTVSTRLRRLIDRGVVEVIGILDERALPRAHTVVALMRGVASDFLASWRDRHGLVFAAQAIGAWDSLACIIGRDPQDVEQELEALRQVADVIEVHTVLSIDVAGLQRGTPVPIRDGLDRDVACLLSTDARISFTSIASTLDIPESTARARAQRLLDGHVVTPMVLPNPAVFGFTGGAMAVEVAGPVNNLDRRLAEVPGVVSVLRLQGRYAAAVELIAPDAAAIVAVREALLALPGVRAVEVMTYGDRIIGRWPLPAVD